MLSHDFDLSSANYGRSALCFPLRRTAGAGAVVRPLEISDFAKNLNYVATLPKILSYFRVLS